MPVAGNLLLIRRMGHLTDEQTHLTAKPFMCMTLRRLDTEFPDAQEPGVAIGVRAASGRATVR